MNSRALVSLDNAAVIDSEDMVAVAARLWNSGLRRNVIATQIGLTPGQLDGLIKRNRHRFARGTDRHSAFLRQPTAGQVELRRMASAPEPARYVELGRLASPRPIERAPGDPISLTELTERTCKWPVSGEPADMLFCGGRIEFGTVYCSVHQAKAWQKPRCREVKR